MAKFQKNSCYELSPDICPCDLHLVEYLKQEQIEGKTLFHFGTGAHHTIGLENAKLATPNFILGVTAAEPEHGRYVNMAVADPLLAKHYKVLFADIYTVHEKLLPNFDVVLLFHLCEFYMPKYADRLHHDDESLLRMFVSKTQSGGRLLFYRGSFAWPRAEVLVNKLVNEGLLKPAGEYKQLSVFKTA